MYFMCMYIAEVYIVFILCLCIFQEYILYLFYVYVYCRCVCVCVAASRSQKRELDPLELKLQGTMSCLWVLGTTSLRSSARAVSAHNC